jgi:DnaJ-class molecular chaperone
MDDPYSVLGLARGATEKDIQAAYRKLAKAHHPDLNPGKAHSDAFKKIAAAYDLLKDPDKRKAYDEGRIDADGNPKPPPGWGGGFPGADGRARRRGGAAPGGGFSGGFSTGGDMNDVLRDLFGAFTGMGEGARGGAGAEAAALGANDLRYTLRLPFREACEGGRKEVKLPDGRTLAVAVPPGTRDGATLRLRGQGVGTPRGDAYIKIEVEPDSLFTRQENDIHAPLSISIVEAALGGKVEAPTLAGPVRLTIPKGANTGQKLRLKGKGVLDAKSGVRGDHYVELAVVMPKTIDAELAEFLEKWGEKHGYDPRGSGS